MVLKKKIRPSNNEWGSEVSIFENAKKKTQQMVSDQEFDCFVTNLHQKRKK